MVTDRGSCHVVQLILTVARYLQQRAIAEGIETAIQLDRLRKLGCEFGQGYLFSQALEAEPAEQLLRRQGARAAAAQQAPG